MEYLTSCEGLPRRDVPALDKMIGDAVEVGYATFRRNVGGAGLDEWAKEAGYDTGNERGGLRLRNDWHVRYYRSKWKGKRCYYMDHSSIEYIWG